MQPNGQPMPVPVTGLRPWTTILPKRARTNILDAKVVYAFYPEHNFSKKPKARQGQVARRLWARMAKSSAS